MKVFRTPEDSQITRPTVLTLGVFDGLHLGHQLIMKRVVERAAATGFCPTVVTFDPHPRAVLRPETAPPLLHTFEQKVEGLGRLGIRQLVVLSFTPEFAGQRAEDFLVNTIFGSLDAREVYLGHGFAFGHKREGRFPLLKEVADRLGRVAEEIPEVTVRGRRVSSTMVRRLLSAGRVNFARRMLGRPYGIEGRVVGGRNAGRAQLSYATANLKTENCVIPQTGVYITLTLVGGEWRRSVTNVGHRPTFGGDPEVVIETHIIDFDRDIYGEKIRVRFLHRLRGEKKFESVEALRAQIDRDYRRAVRYFSMNHAHRSLEFH
jgi:riboflavin kinase/FMN adenylyltransferase